jgi:uncharacterized protein (DUF305 family)
VGFLLLRDDDPPDDGVRTVQPGAPGEASREIDGTDVEAPDHTEADVAFMQQMIGHHRQALAMTALVAERSERDDLPLLAERITLSQEDEIERLTEWLTARDETVPADHDAHGSMPGMATPEQLAQLEGARGPAFDQLFLDLMITHHQGALTMVADLYRAGGGLEPEADRFAREIEADQAVEINRMDEIAADLGS